jgi:putative transposase
MSNYRHNRVPGHTWFFTVRLADPTSTLLTEHISAFGEAMRHARGRKPFHVDAWVVLHDHAHAIWTLPAGDADCASRWRAVKIAFSKAVRKLHRAPLRTTAIWQRHYQQHAIADDAHYRHLVDYVHANPVTHGMCSHAVEWPWSSVHRFVAEGLIVPPESCDVLASMPSSTSSGDGPCS